MKHHQQKRRFNNKGFTLIEILIASAIGLLLLGTLIGALIRGGDSGKAAGVASLIHNVQNSCALFAKEHGSTFPITESAVAGAIPASGTNVGGAANIGALSAAATFDNVLLAERALDRGLKLELGSNLAPTGSTPVLWDTANQVFYNVADTVPTTDYTACNRLEVAAVGAADAPLFLLDGQTGLGAGRKVVFLVIPKCGASMALAISKAIDKSEFSAADASVADTKGAVIYSLPDAQKNVTVYIHVFDI